MFKEGDSVRVKPGVKDPDLGFDIGGWQGRVYQVERFEGVDYVDIAWDSATLRAMGIDLAIKCSNDNLNWCLMTLCMEDLEKVEPRDTESDVAETFRAMESEMEADPRYIVE